MTEASVSWRRIVLPTEHGAWAFLAEPLVLGLIVAPSLAGLLVVFATLAAFTARQPLRLFLSDQRRRQRYPRTVMARRAFAVLAVAAVLAITGAVLLSRGPTLLALGLAAPLAALALFFDARLRSRELAAMIAAALALASSASAMALAKGWEIWPALSLWGILAARAVPSVLYVRARLRLDRRKPANVSVALVAHVLAVAWAGWLAAQGFLPWTGVAAIVLLAARAVYGLSPHRPRLTTPQLGLSEIVFGAVTVLAVGLGIMFRA